jgi:hypothetical protein
LQQPKGRKSEFIAFEHESYFSSFVQWRRRALPHKTCGSAHSPWFP